MKRLPRLDFLARVPPRRTAGWWLLGLGALALGMALALTAPRAGTTDPGPGRAPGQAPPQAGLDRPAGPPRALLFALEAAHGRGTVTLLALEPQGNPPRLRLRAQAADLAGMLEWLRQLEADQRLAQVTLLHHEWRAAAPAAPGSTGAAGTAAPQVHFEVQALWRTDSSPG